MDKDSIVKKRYERIAKEYDSRRFGSEPGKIIDKRQKKVLLEFLRGMPKNSKIIEVGCGSGRFLEFLGKNGFKNLYGIDQSKEMLKIAGRRTKANLRKGDIYNIPFKKDFFDVVFSIHVLMHLKKPEQALKEMVRIAKRRIIFEVNNKNSISGILAFMNPGYRPRFFSLGEIEKMTGYSVKAKTTYALPLKAPFPKLYYKVLPVLEKTVPKKFSSQFLVQITKSQ